MTSQRKQFPFPEFESRWQATWLKEGAFRSANPGDPDFDGSKPKYYVLDMFPYPSGDGLHVGHVEGYTATDIIARSKRMQGFNVLHPMGWDAFGLPAEQYAIRTGRHPRETTNHNIANFRSQLQSLGFSYDWSREISTTHPEYFRWTQWIFLQLYNAWFNPDCQKAEPISTYSGNDPDSVRLAYVAEVPVNWCQELGTVLANEEVVDGKSEVGGFPVERRPLRQWMLRITAYSDRLLEGLDALDWPEGVKLLQRNWIGRSEGATVQFPIANTEFELEVFTTRPDTLFGATYVVLSPEHPLVAKITTADQADDVSNYQKKISSKSDLERTELSKEKTGVFTGAYAVNPANGDNVLVWIADYVLLSYGTGAIMAVPAHDERDFEFAKAFGLPIREVVRPANMGTPGGTGVPPVVSSTPFFEKDREIKIHERNFPHWQQESKSYFVTWRLADSLPVELLSQWRQEANAWLASKASPLPTEDELEYHRLFSDRIEKSLDSGLGSCLLKDSRFSQIVENALNHFDGARYDLHAFVVMPNHVHVLFTLLEGEDSSRIIHSWKSFAAHEINKARGQSGEVWQEEYFDRIVRDQQHFSRLVAYIENNPAKAGLIGVRAYTGGTDVPPADPPDTVPVAAPACFSGEGVAINSGFLDGMPTSEAKAAMLKFLAEQGSGLKTVTTKLRDWLFSRQRYWGEPFPIIWEGGRHHALSEHELPVIQPEMADFKPTGTSEPPLAKATEWVAYSETARRETNTMPQWAGSCWYYLRYCDARLETRFVGEQAENYWMSSAGPGGVDLYVGGTEHAVLHLLYARFWHKVLFDLGQVSSSEPFRKLVNQGMILGPDGQKMSKSRGNVVTPEHVISEYGADSLRLYEMFMGPLEQMKPWSMKGVEGVYRFLARVWRLAMKENQEGQWEISSDLTDEAPTASQLRVLHASIKKVTEDFDGMAFNTAIAQLMVCTNEFVNASPRPVESLRILLPLLSPLAPHLCDELWRILGTKFIGFEGRASTACWPVYDAKILEVEEIELIIQINGKLKDRLRIGKTSPEDDVLALAMASPKIQEAVAGKTIVKTILVPGKLLNLVVK